MEDNLKKKQEERDRKKAETNFQAGIFNSLDQILNVVRDDSVSDNIIAAIGELKSSIESLEISDEASANLLREVSSLKENFKVYSDIFAELKSLRIATEAASAKEWSFDVLRDGTGKIDKIRAIKVK